MKYLTEQGLLERAQIFPKTNTCFVSIPFLELKPQPCDSSPCRNGGICNNEGESFSCECKCENQGKTCEGTAMV